MGSGPGGGSARNHELVSPHWSVPDGLALTTGGYGRRFHSGRCGQGQVELPPATVVGCINSTLVR